MKKIISIIFALLLIFSAASPCLAALGGDDAVLPSAVEKTQVAFSIDSTGKSTTVVRCSGTSDVTKIKLVVFYKEKFGDIWERVDLKFVNDQIECTEEGSSMSRTFKIDMPDKGKTYRVTVEAKYYGNTTVTETRSAIAVYN